MIHRVWINESDGKLAYHKVDLGLAKVPALFMIGETGDPTEFVEIMDEVSGLESTARRALIFIEGQPGYAEAEKIANEQA